MTSPQEPTDALDGLERRALELARRSGEAADWESLLGDLQSLPLSGAPPLDPDDARGSGEELRRLIAALRQQSLPASGSPVSGPNLRVGYLIEGARGSDEARARPAFAEALAAPVSAPSLRQEFPDLWAVDLGLWRQLGADTPDLRALALAWLSSPGRRLVQDFSVLRHVPARRDIGACDFSPQRLLEAAGPLPVQAPSEPGEGSWYELHAAVPGLALDRWKPATDDVGTVLQILEGRRGDPVFLRGAALAWLLDRAAANPSYELNGLRRDLRVDLLPSIIIGFPDPQDGSRHLPLRSAARFETACLLQASRLVFRRDEQDVARCWSLARWIQSCTFRSPFFGMDEEAIAARLNALLPPVSVAAANRRDVLEPECFGEGDEGLRLEELALVAGVVRHYWPEEVPRQPQLLPTPLPLVQALRRLALRTLNPGEQRAEQRLRCFQQGASPSGARPQTLEVVENGLGWSAHHVAPPLVARWLMTHHRLAWLEQAPPEVRRESLDLFEREPERHAWVAFAVHSEGSRLDSAARSEVAAVWRRVVQATGGRLGSRGALALMAVGLLEQLAPEDAQRLLPLAREAEPVWRYRALEALAKAAEAGGHLGTWRDAMEGLLEMMGDERLKVEERLGAAQLALKQASATSRPELSGYLPRVVAAAAVPPFRHSSQLQRELRKLGLSSSLDS
ncbi:MAG TPA: hypothetical protein VFZ09_34000 [Archangium sp.]|uniref:hypothetical protein n=1 Tax=Archangium sp. TaxID=1872627 RepID=UPI002E31481F|nr:hypothetical protein [Archangium sp.]HEX5751287.1 hypothetical protein [Archangium sp.]